MMSRLCDVNVSALEVPLTASSDCPESYRVLSRAGWVIRTAPMRRRHRKAGLRRTWTFARRAVGSDHGSPLDARFASVSARGWSNPEFLNSVRSPQLSDGGPRAVERGVCRQRQVVTDPPGTGYRSMPAHLAPTRVRRST